MKKNITLINNEWVEYKTPSLTDEELELLNSVNNNYSEEKENLINKIHNESFVPITIQEVNTVQEIYNKHKIDNAHLIDIYITLPDETGIINYRIGEEHKQIRF